MVTVPLVLQLRDHLPAGRQLLRLRAKVWDQVIRQVWLGGDTGVPGSDALLLCVDERTDRDLAAEPLDRELALDWENCIVFDCEGNKEDVVEYDVANQVRFQLLCRLLSRAD